MRRACSERNGHTTPMFGNKQGKKVSNGKCLDGKPRLTESAVNVVQNYYGMVTGQNTHSTMALRDSYSFILLQKIIICSMDCTLRYTELMQIQGGGGKKIGVSYVSCHAMCGIHLTLSQAC